MNATSSLTQSLSETESAWVQATTRMFCLQFDVARHQYAMAQRLGLIERSLLAWAQFERALVAMECWTLGPPLAMTGAEGQSAAGGCAGQRGGGLLLPLVMAWRLKICHAWHHMDR